MPPGPPGTSDSRLIPSQSMLPVEHLSSDRPCKALLWAFTVTPQDCRIFNCERCHQEVVICRRCDRGNRYCPPCAPLARAEKQRAAGKQYQQKEAGRLNHKVRQEHYRARLAKEGEEVACHSDCGKEALEVEPVLLEYKVEKVTHHGDLELSLERNSAVATLEGSHENYDECREEPPAPPWSLQRRCDFCGRPCLGAARTGPLPRRRHSFQRGPRLPVWRGF